MADPNTQYRPPDVSWNDPAPAGAKPRFNTCAIVGFILAFPMWIAGLIVSIVALIQIGRRRERGRGLAVAGVIISVIMGLLSLTVGAVMITGAVNELNQRDNVSQSKTVGKAKPRQLDEKLDKSLDDLEKDDSADVGSAKLYPSMDALANSPLFQNQMKAGIGGSFDGTGATITYRAEGDTLVIDILLPASYDAAATQLAAQLNGLDDSSMQQFANTLPGMVDTTGTPGLKLVAHTPDLTIWERAWTAQQ